MEKIFLDTNTFIDLVEGRDLSFEDTLSKLPLFISVVSPLVLTYIYKYEVPNKKLKNVLKEFTIVFANNKLVDKSLEGPISDFEDNLQLHSAVEANCDVFLTKDRGLLKLGYFGKVRVMDVLD